jgi:hypothetical protein
MKVTYLPSVERFRASSDLLEKLVTIWSEEAPTPGSVLLGTSIEPIWRPCESSSCRTMAEVTPNAGSRETLLKT